MNRENLGAMSDGELFDLAIEEYADPETEDDDDEPSSPSPVSELQRRGGSEIFEEAKALCSSEDAPSREVGLDILAQLDFREPDEDRPHRSDSVEIAAGLLDDPAPYVVRSAAWALVHLKTEKAIGLLIGLKNHHDSDVRHAVAHGLAGQEGSLSVETLIALMSDNCDDVRDWATFSLGTLCEADSLEIRAALQERLSDRAQDVREEALWGLAKRKDKAALALLLERLSGESWLTADRAAAEDALELTKSVDLDELKEGIRELVKSHDSHSDT